MTVSAPPATRSLAQSADEVETRFYQALQRGDLELLMSLWADDDEVMCVHPGGPRVVGLAAIRASFQAIFANGGIPVQPEDVHRLPWLGGAVHHLLERISVQGPQGQQTAWVMATNVYVKGPLGWQMAAHHAIPATPREQLAAPETPGGGRTPSVLH